jgi:hypothetical protein
MSEDPTIYRQLPEKQAVSQRSREAEQFAGFLVVVRRVDYESKILTVEDTRTNIVYNQVKIFPTVASSPESTDEVMVQEGAIGLAFFLEGHGSMAELAISTWIVTDTLRAIDAIATRPMTAKDSLHGWTNRNRGVYRKAYPGQKVSTLSAGFTEKMDEGWDRTSSDFSREKLDSFKRTKFGVTGRTVNYTDAGLTFEGPVNRPNASTDDVTPRLMPDGSNEWVVYLSSKSSKLSDKYKKGTQDLLPIVERTEKIQEFALDFPLPLEVLESDYLDKVLGLSKTSDEWWSRTSVKDLGDKFKVAYEDQSYMVDQGWDHPLNSSTPIGPTTSDGPSPRRRGWIIEKSEGTLVGSNSFDKTTYGKVLKPTIFPYTKEGRFGTSVESGYIPVVKKSDQVETRMAASAWSLRFPYEYNTTRFDITKEGHIQFEVGSTIPKENIAWDGQSYEHPYGAGRSLDGHFLGSVRLVIGKNRDDEDSLDLTTLGGTVLRLGADDTSLPTTRRAVNTQIRGKKDSIQARDIQFWGKSKFKSMGDAGDLNSKIAGENVSLRASLDGGMLLRLGARDKASRRKHLRNGYEDGQGRAQQSPFDATRQDSRSKGRPIYGVGDSHYRFHDLAKAGSPVQKVQPYSWSGDAVGDMDTTGLSADIHAVRDILIRIGANEQNGQSLLADLAGGIVAAVGKDKQGRSLTAAFDGGIEATIGSNNEKKGLRLEINGDVDIAIRGNLHLNVTGDISIESVRSTHVAKIMMVNKSLSIIDRASVVHTTEAPEIIHNQGFYDSPADSN